MRAGGGWALALLLGGCSRADHTAAGYPPLGTAKSMLLALTQQGRLLKMLAVPLEPSPSDRLTLQADSGRNLELDAWLFNKTLAELGLLEGEVPQPEPGAPSRPIPAADALFSAAASPSAAISWTPRSDLGSLSELRIPAWPCADWSTDTWPLDDLTSPLWLLPLATEAALLGISSPPYVERVERHLAVPLQVLPAPVGLISSALRTDDGQLWLGGGDGRIYRAAVLEATVSLTLVATASSGEAVIGFLVQGPEIFTLDELGTLKRFDGSAWTILHRFAFDARDLAGGELIAPAPGEVIAVSNKGNDVVWYHRDGQLTVDHLDASGELSAAANIAGVGVLVSDNSGPFFIHQAKWELFPMPVSAGLTRTTTILPYEDGFFYGGRFGFLGQYHGESQSFCPTQMKADYTVHTAAPFGRGFIVAAVSRDDILAPRMTVVEP